MKGTEEQFDLILRELAKNTKMFDLQQIKHIQYTERAENIYQSYGWSKQEIFKEIGIRLGHAKEEKPPEIKVAKKRAAPKKKPAVR